jgi:hypothetical protein
VNPALAQRTVVLAAVALLAVVAALAIAAVAGGSSSDESTPGSVPVPGTGWYRALAAPYRVDRGKRQETACGQRATGTTLGLAHPVLPCGAKIVVAYGDHRVLTQVIDRSTGIPGREFELTAGLAHLLDLQGVQLIRWRFAAPANG